MEEMLVSQDHLEVLVHDEHGILYQGAAQAVTSINEQGIFDILPDHTNFITLIKDKLEIVTTQGEKQTFAVAGGILHCYTSQVEVYLGVGEK
jgi:F0F1-type ATP synthase epsilon subunit